MAPDAPDAPDAPPDRSGAADETHRFDPANLDRTVLAVELRRRIFDDPDAVYPVIIDLNLRYPGGREMATRRVAALLELIARTRPSTDPAAPSAGAPDDARTGLDLDKSAYSPQYLFGRFPGRVIQELVRFDGTDPATLRSVLGDYTGIEGASEIRRAWVGAGGGDADLERPVPAIYRIWSDQELRPLTDTSIRTVKCDAAQRAFAATGEGVVWAVCDSGIDATHPHFATHTTLELPAPLEHRSFLTGEENDRARTDPFGHGTHVAGIIAGAFAGAAGDEREEEEDDAPAIGVRRRRAADGEVGYERLELSAIAGMAPHCRLLSLRVLDDAGIGHASDLIAAIGYLQQLNGYGRELLVHGVNLSVGYEFDAEWFACGKSPLCVEVDRLVRSGVVVVVAAGNTGYAYAQTSVRTISAGRMTTINDPGNAELAITVGSTHRASPHTYGVSYFSSKGPTGDGRLKPDLVAPGEKILSCAAGIKATEAEGKLRAQRELGDDEAVRYVEDSGTSMAAPHVSGAIAAFLSIRPEFVGQPERIKELFNASATDLGRERYFQGHGLVDLMRAIQSL